MGTIFGGNTGETLDSAEMRSRMAMAMLQNATSAQPIQSPWQGVNQLAQALMGGMMMKRSRDAEAAAYGQLFGALGPGGFGTPSGGSGAGGGSTAPAGGGGGSAASTLSPPSVPATDTPAPAGHDSMPVGDVRNAGPADPYATFGPSVDPRLSTDFGRNLIGVESEGNPNSNMASEGRLAYHSSASGLGQMLDGEWQKYGDPRYQHAYQAPQDVQLAALGNYLKSDKIAALDRMGLPVNDTTVYIAHNIGQGGLHALVSADPNASAAAVVSAVDPRAAANNPTFFRGNPTVGQVLSRYQTTMAGGGAAHLRGGAGDDQLADPSAAAGQDAPDAGGFVPSYNPGKYAPLSPSAGAPQDALQPGLAPNDNGAALAQPPAGMTAVGTPQDQPPMPPQAMLAPPQAGEPGRPAAGPQDIAAALMAQQGAQPLPHPISELPKIGQPVNLPDPNQAPSGSPVEVPAPQDLRGQIAAAIAQQGVQGADGGAPVVAPALAQPNPNNAPISQPAAAAPNANAGASDAVAMVPRSVGNPLGKAGGGGVSEPATPDAAVLPVPQSKPADLRSTIEAAAKGGTAGTDSTGTQPAAPKVANAGTAGAVPPTANASFYDAAKPGSSAMTAYRSSYTGQDNRAAPGQQNVLQALLGKVLPQAAPANTSGANPAQNAGGILPGSAPLASQGGQPTLAGGAGAGVMPGASGPAASGAPAAQPSPQNTASLDQVHGAIQQAGISNPRIEALRQVAMNPYAPPEARRMALQMAMQYAVPQIEYITRADGSVVGINKLTGQTGQVLGGLKNPSFQEVDDPATGLKRKVEVDPTTGQVIGELTPNGLVKAGEGGKAAASGTAPAGGDALTPPPGVNPIKFREAAGTAAGKYAYDNAHATFSDEREARKQILEDTPYQHLADSTPYYNAMIKQAKEDTAPADKALIDNFVKIANPGRAVNTGSFILNADAQSLLGGIWGDVKKAWDGQGKLLPDVRAQMLRISQLKMGEYQKTYQSSIEGYRDLLEGHGMNLERVAPKLPTLDTWDPKEISTLDTRGGSEGKVSQPKNATAGDLPKPQPPGGTPIVKPNGVIIQPLGD